MDWPQSIADGRYGSVYPAVAHRATIGFIRRSYSAMRHGEVMRPLDFSSLQLADEMRLHPDVERYARLSYETSASEIVSDPETWTTEQTQAYAKRCVVRYIRPGQCRLDRFFNSRTSRPARKEPTRYSLEKRLTTNYGPSHCVVVAYLFLGAIGRISSKRVNP